MFKMNINNNRSIESKNSSKFPNLPPKYGGAARKGPFIQVELEQKKEDFDTINDSHDFKEYSIP